MLTWRELPHLHQLASMLPGHSSSSLFSGSPGWLRLVAELYAGITRKLGGASLQFQVVAELYAGINQKLVGACLQFQDQKKPKDPSLGDDPSRTRTYFFHSQERRSPGWRRKDPSRGFLAFRKALSGLEAERSVSGISCSQERRSPGWRQKDPSRGFLAPKKRRSPSWRREDREFPIPRRWKDPSRKFLAPRRGGQWAGGERSVSGFFYSQERRSLGWRRKDPSRGISYS